MRIMQWNIGGGRIRDIVADPKTVDSYDTEALDYIARIVEQHNPDIITLQETHQSNNGHNQTQLLADMVGLEYWINDTHNESHIEKGQKIGQGIVSRFPIAKHHFQRMPNPNLMVVSENGQELHSHNYGISTAEIEAPDGIIRVQTLHLPALHFFNVTPDMAIGKQILREVDKSIERPACPTVIVGDYNLDFNTVLDLLPRLKAKGFRETQTGIGTTPNGKKLDHLLYFGFNSIALSVIGSVLTDHFPIIADIE